MKFKVVLVALAISLTGINAVWGAKLENGSEQYMSATQVRALFSDKKFNGKNHKTGKRSHNISKSDGTMRADVIGGPEWNIKWWVDDAGQHCLKHPKFGTSCGGIIDAGQGVYHRIVKGKKANTYEKFESI